MEDCYGRSKTKLGSSTTYPANTSAWSARDVLLPDCDVNPAFCNWSTVYQPYVRMGSFLAGGQQQ